MNLFIKQKQTHRHRKVRNTKGGNRGRDKSGVQDCYIHTAAAAKSLQSCPTLCNPIDGSPPGSAIPGNLQARTLEWV